MFWNLRYIKSLLIAIHYYKNVFINKQQQFKVTNANIC